MTSSLLTLARSFQVCVRFAIIHDGDADVLCGRSQNGSTKEIKRVENV